MKHRQFLKHILAFVIGQLALSSCLAQSKPQVLRQNRIVLVGDSFWDEESLAGPEYTQVGPVIQRRLEALGCNVAVRNAGHSGSKTGGGQTISMAKRIANIWAPCYSAPYLTSDCPTAGIINGSVNDVFGIVASTCTWSGGVLAVPVASNSFAVGDVLLLSGFDQSSLDGWQTVTSDNGANITFTVAGSGSPSSGSGQCWGTLDTETNLRGLMRAGEFGCKGIVSSQAALPVDGVDGDRYAVLYDTSGTGGATFPAGSYQALPQITGAIANNTFGNSEPTVWEYRSGQNGAFTGGGEAGWARVARASTPPTHIKYWFISNLYYLNFSSGGDTQSTQPFKYSSLTAGALRYSQNRAVSDETAAGNGWVSLIDSYTATFNLVASGKSMQGDHLFHVADGNVHPSESGASWWSDIILQAIQANGNLMSLLKIGPLIVK